jgi:hypothetical protein
VTLEFIEGDVEVLPVSHVLAILAVVVGTIQSRQCCIFQQGNIVRGFPDSASYDQMDQTDILVTFQEVAVAEECNHVDAEFVLLY